MDKYSYINEVINFTEQFLDNSKVISENINQYNCVLCGRSKNNSPHMRIDYNNGFFYCYRCNEGGILYNLIKEFKNNSNKEYVNSILKIYFSFYEYNPSDKKIKSIDNYNSYDFSIDNLSINKISNLNFSELQEEFFKKRFPSINKNQLISRIEKFKINLHNSTNKIFYNSYYRKFAYSYIINNDLSHRKEKLQNPKINNDKKDYYYLLNNFNYSNLYISEGLFDLITMDIVNPLHNTDKSNFLALCCRNYKFLYEILLTSGKFFYKNIYIILDNDINEKSFIDGIVSTLSNVKNREKFKLYENIYKINVPDNFIDLNEYYLSDYNLTNLLIKKII